jgi:hypothetical protein
MKCFNHPDIDAVGICKSCNKGLCKNCLTELENGIACTTTCVEEVKQINSLINRNKKSYKVASSSYIRNAYLFGCIGLVFIIFGFTREGLTGFLSIMGAIFILGAFLSYISAKKYKKTE